MAKTSSRLSFSVSFDEDDGNVAFVIVIRPLGVGTIPTRAHIAHKMELTISVHGFLLLAATCVVKAMTDSLGGRAGRRALNHLSVSVVRPSDRRVTDIIGDAFGRSR